MTVLKFEEIALKMAEVGAPNPLPPFTGVWDPGASVPVDESVPEAARRHLGYGCESVCLPYAMQDGYSRTLAMRQTPAAVLENEVLRATFLLGLGGRLWSLVHKPTGRELLYRNPVIQPANLSVRNAWFSGGVEWNCGVRGHSPQTCSPLFAGRVDDPRGYPVLRLYEWERIRQVPYQIDFHLPPGSPVLHVHVRIENPTAETVPMYWWSNIAVPEEATTRVVVPAGHSFNFANIGKLKRIATPFYEGQDVSYSSRLRNSADWFYDIPPGTAPYIASVNGEGWGLVQASTAALRGRKMFNWGIGAGNRRWQEFLSEGYHPYLEIQAGVAQTQYECFPLEAGASIAWTEVYGHLEADAEAVQGPEWSGAQRAVEKGLAALITGEALAREDAAHRRTADLPLAELAHLGAGWGALEDLRRRHGGQAPLSTPSRPFPERSLGKEQRPWTGLLAEGVFPALSERPYGDGWLVQPEWRQLLEEAVTREANHKAGAWLHLGVMRRAAQDTAGAEAAWQESLRLGETALALRNLATLAAHRGDPAAAALLWERAHRRDPELFPLALEMVVGLNAAGRHADALARIAAFPEAWRSHGRIRLQAAVAHHALGDLDTVKRFLADATLEVIDLREGENTLTDLWFAVMKDEAGKPLPPPRWLDFRMMVDA